MPKAERLPTSSADFNLPANPPITSLGASFIDDSSIIAHRFRRPSLLAPKAGIHGDSRLHSPLAASFKPLSHRRRASQSTSSLDEYDTFWSDISPPSSSENPTPPLTGTDNADEPRRSAPPSTPPRRSLSRGSDRSKGRRMSYPLKTPRILNLLAESRTVENEVQSEAAFQRLLASGVDIPRTPRTVADRGRFPEEAVQDDLFQREDTPSDDDDDDADFAIPHGTDPINIKTPAGSVAGSVNGDEMFVAESPSLSAMDVDVPSGSPSLSSISSMSISGWRSTPPPTTSAVRSNKRKFDERFDPYQNASKRRAVSPSLSHLLPSSPKSRSNPRLPIAIPIISGSAVSSAASSPTIGVGTAAYFAMARPVSSPILRSMGLASPILRPIPRRRGEEEEREIEGVGGLTLG
ncbi:hypothetical protein MIND_00506100 [Mycena indigotica]|uniref:Uncharacterized protein n=1 Tax=Mycena indigotica TaxID=2126181 RepID=A0A8H6W6Y5_9AGAR|nr:uncharacterized protein MIND_00506100 [Mycena indigotica]KAF7307127.1 hypothetical protein MIND_00506100 [Mycena indigotica]